MDVKCVLAPPLPLLVYQLASTQKGNAEIEEKTKMLKT